MISELSLFSGSGGGLLGSILIGWTTIGYVESDEYCQRVITARIKDGALPVAPIFGDIRSFLSEGYAASYKGLVDVVSGGFPCQPFSTASRGRKVAPDVWPFMRSVVEIVEPRHVFAENVQRAPIAQAASDLQDLGYLVRCGRFSAASVGAPHRRPRQWLVATDTDNAGQCTIPFDAQVASLSGPTGLAWTDPPTARVLGIYDGASHRVDRMRAIANGQVPSVALAAWRELGVTL